MRRTPATVASPSPGSQEPGPCIPTARSAPGGLKAPVVSPPPPSTKSNHLQTPFSEKGRGWGSLDMGGGGWYTAPQPHSMRCAVVR